MGNSSESDSAHRGGPLSGPLLIECDRRGRVLWMSTEARVSFGDVHYLIDLVRSRTRAERDVSAAQYVGLHIVQAFEVGDRVLISAQFEGIRQLQARNEAVLLLRLQCSLMQHYFRLERAAKLLAIRANRKRPSPGRQAILQLERERQRLGRELHTGVGQLLAAIRVQLEIIASEGVRYSPSVTQSLDRVSTLADQALEQVRSVSRRLHPPEWQRLPLAVALQQLWEISGIEARYRATLRIDPLPKEPSLETKVLVYRAVQEAFSNLARHSKATRIEMSLGIVESQLVLTIQDNGIGFHAARLFSNPPTLAAGIGLRSIREQAITAGGELAVDSGPDGTTFRLSVPLDQEG